MKISFTVEGTPLGKGRPRYVRTQKGIMTYTPEQTVNYENLVKLSYINGAGPVKLEGPLQVTIECYFPVPASTSRKKRDQMLRGEIRHTKKPDCDNLAKSILDALNGVAYDDDKQICRLDVFKNYGDRAGAVVTIEELKPGEIRTPAAGCPGAVKERSLDPLQ